LWRRALGKARAPGARWRWLRSLLLALAIGLSLALALARPELATPGRSHQRLVVILDNSSSMGARTGDGGTRWQHALAGARQLILGAAAGSEVMVLDTTGRTPLNGFVPSERALEELARPTLSPEPSGRVSPLPAGAAITAAYLFTDGVGIDAVPGGIAVRSVFEPAGNIGISAFEGRPVPSEPTRYEVLLRLENAAPTPRQATLELMGANGFRVERHLRLPSGATAQILDVSGYEQGALRAQIRSEDDAFDLDDSAYCLVPPHRVRRVLLVTDGNDALADSLRALPAVAVSVRRPAALAALPAFDAYVFDRFVPREPPPAGALLFRPPDSAWLAPKFRPAGPAVVSSWDESHPLTTGVTWPDLRLDSAQLAQPGAGAVVTARPAGASRSGGLVVAGRARARWVAVGFALPDSNFSLQPGFPVFLGTALDWLTDRPAVASESLGQVEVPIANAHIHDAHARLVRATATARGTLFEARRPAVYVASSANERLLVVANATDPRTARINDTRLPPASADVERSGPPRQRWPEPWVGLLVLAFALLALEWGAFSRRLTE
jgi:hypothetical protein